MLRCIIAVKTRAAWMEQLMEYGFLIQLYVKRQVCHLYCHLSVHLTVSPPLVFRTCWY